MPKINTLEAMRLTLCETVQALTDAQALLDDCWRNCDTTPDLHSNERKHLIAKLRFQLEMGPYPWER